MCASFGNEEFKSKCSYNIAILFINKSKPPNTTDPEGHILNETLYK
jgi:hypothetical protein